MHEFVELVKALAWPTTLLIAVYTLRSELRLFMTRLADAVSQAAQITVGRRGLDIKLSQRIAAVNTRVTAVQAVQIQTRTSKGKKLRVDNIPEELLALAAQYSTLQIDDYRARLHRKNDIAREMGEIVVKSGIDRSLLLASRDEALALAMAAATISEPTGADIDRILDASYWCKRLHVRYRMVLAISVLINEGLTPIKSHPRILQALTEIGVGADQPLIDLLKDTGALLDSIVDGEIRAPLQG